MGVQNLIGEQLKKLLDYTIITINMDLDVRFHAIHMEMKIKL